MVQGLDKIPKFTHYLWRRPCEIGLLLKGSKANGTARPYSDVDVSIYGNVSKDIIEEILYGFEKPLMINASEKPPGLLIIVYRKGLALDLGIKGGESIDKDGESISLVRPSIPGHRMPNSPYKHFYPGGQEHSG